MNDKDVFGGINVRVFITILTTNINQLDRIVDKKIIPRTRKNIFR